MAGVAGLEPVTSAVTGQRSNQLSYTPAMGERENKKINGRRQDLVGAVSQFEKIRAADAKEVGVGNPAEETCCYPNIFNVTVRLLFVNKLSDFPPIIYLGFTRCGFGLHCPRYARVGSG